MARPDLHRAELVAATGRLLRRQGYSGTTVSDFLTAAGASNGSLYHHFPSGKEDLARTAIEAAAAEVETQLERTLSATNDIAAATQAWLDALIAGLAANPQDGCPVAPTAIDAAGVSEPLRLAAADAFRCWLAVFERALARTRDADTAASLARVLLSAIEGALLLDRTAHSTSNLEALRAAIPMLLADRET
ncbi:MAG TPA: TetR/AcrR family transcriptional regulator [Solirubrobacteraceae bacterium]|jgi:TetR/AcrR family transcriptional repressor of lmrAB and yxaGH operons|nr:TetR/AcrR family transcriptional regulator [Solirubrobacteraceae bacterium]